MNIYKTQNTSFKGTVHLLNAARANDPVLRPLIHHLKYNCGNKNIHHYIDVSDTNNTIQSLFSAYYSKTKGAGGFCVTIGGAREKTAEYVKELIRRTYSIHPLYIIVKNQEIKINQLSSELNMCKDLLNITLGNDKKVAKLQPESFLTALSRFLSRKKK